MTETNMAAKYLQLLEAVVFTTADACLFYDYIIENEKIVNNVVISGYVTFNNIERLSDPDLRTYRVIGMMELSCIPSSNGDMEFTLQAVRNCMRSVDWELVINISFDNCPPFILDRLHSLARQHAKNELKEKKKNKKLAKIDRELMSMIEKLDKESQNV